MQNKSVDELIEQFDRDGYYVDPDQDVVEMDGCHGIRASSKTATIGKSGVPKVVYYVEGTGRQMGYLLGSLAYEDILEMCTVFVPHILFNYLKIDDPAIQAKLKRIMLDFGYWLARPIRKDIPQCYLDELDGICEACDDAQTPISADDLFLLNVGFDALMAVGYTEKLPLRVWPFNVDSSQIRIPAWCNGFCISGATPQDYCYLGRNFQFSTAGVFEKSATMIIRNPAIGKPTISVAAPGMVGSITGINSMGIGIGVDMLPGANCDVARPGINSLMLNRYCLDNANSYDNAVNLLQNAQRGVSWLYVLGSGATNQSCFVECGKCSSTSYDGLSYMEQSYHDAAKKARIDFDQWITDFASNNFTRGMAVRENSYTYPDEPTMRPVNTALIDNHRALHPADYFYRYQSQDFSEMGRINPAAGDHNCPGLFYFAPQREQRSDLVIGTNGAITPHMRLYGMTSWLYAMAGGSADDIQNRYDTYNQRILTLLKSQGYITYDQAKEIINSSGSLALNSESVIGGAISLIDLKNKTIESHYGFENDKWVKLGLSGYMLRTGSSRAPLV